MIYTFTENHIVSTHEDWTGHIDDYFNKRFLYKTVKPLLVDFRGDDEIIKLIIELHSSEHMEYYNSIENDENLKNALNSLILTKELDKKDLYDKKLSSLLSEKQFVAWKKVSQLISRVGNTLYECIDRSGQRYLLNIFENELKIFDKNDIDIYFKKINEVNKFNAKQFKLKYEFLCNKSAIEDFLNYKNSRIEMFKNINEKLSNLGV